MLNKIWFALFALLFLMFLLMVGNLAVRATFDNCTDTFTYTKSSDFSDSRVNINFESNDNQIDVSAQSGYQITEVALEVADDGFPGFHLYATGSVNNFNPTPGTEIQVAKVHVKKVCPSPTQQPSATPTLQPSVTPTLEPTSATPSPTISIDPTPTREATPSATPTQELPQDTSSSSSLQASAGTGHSDPSCDTPIPNRPEFVTVERGIPNDNKLTLLWPLVLGAQSVNIYYGPYGMSAQHGIADYPNTGTIEIAGLQNGTNYLFCIEGRNGCAVGAETCVDPLP